ncbi:MAG: hypothetical protein R2706_18120 [Acidimicrobiales bacterium]
MLASTSSRDNFADFDVSSTAWILLGLTLLAMLTFDLIRHRDDHVGTTREVLIESMGWIACGLAFGGVIWGVYGADAFGEYIAGYLIEKSLSIDNVFVWSILFSSMAIPVRYQHRVLFWGIFGALALRLAFILIGSALIDRFWWLLLVFGLFLVVTGIRIIQHDDDEGETSTTMGLGYFAGLFT